MARLAGNKEAVEKSRALAAEAAKQKATEEVKEVETVRTENGVPLTHDDMVRIAAEHDARIMATMMAPKPKYTFLSAQFANREQTAAIAVTQEIGFMAISIEDTPELWAQAITSVQFTPYEEPLVSMVIKAEDFFARFTAEEVDAAVAANKSSGFVRLGIIRTVALDDADMLKWLDSLVTEGVLTSKRKTEIISAGGS